MSLDPDARTIFSNLCAYLAAALRLLVMDVPTMMPHNDAT